MRKPAVCTSEKTKAQMSCAVIPQLISPCFRLIDSTIPLLPKSKISSVVVVQPALCQTWLGTPKTGFLAMGLKSGENNHIFYFPDIKLQSLYKLTDVPPNMQMELQSRP